MRYTRYNYKRKNKSGFLIWMILIILMSIAFGIVIFKIFFNEEGSLKPIEPDKLSNGNYQGESYIKDLYFIQCGLYSSEENSAVAVSALPAKTSAFYIKDGEKYKVIAGIYSKDDAKAKSDEFTAGGINNFLIKCSYSINSSESKIVAQIIDGYLQIINKLDEGGVKSINTADFKKWTNDILVNVEKTTEETNALVGNINSLPEEFTKKDMENSKKFLYEILVKYREK